MSRVHNFNAGPAALPLPVLELAQKELCDYRGTGMSIMEHSHRGKAYDEVHAAAIALTRELLGFGDSHEVLLLQGGASLQFAMLPMNFLPAGASADYVLTGGWSEKAFEEAKRVGTARVAATTCEDGRYRRIPKQSELALDPKAAYVHITTNNTLFGTQWHSVPETGEVPLVADMSSDFLWKPIDVSRYALIYAGAQKNVGPSGLAVVIVKKSWLDKARTDIPTILRYATHAKNASLYNTPNTWGIYIMRNVLEHVKREGGLPAVERANRKKADTLYAAIDAAPDFFRCPVERDSRSTMNVGFRLPTEELEAAFVKQATERGMIGLKGHRSTGGIRASIYNAVPLASVEALVAFMGEFHKAHG
ncbi:MAG: 3-phosphoserine/phosphohydroxythreonine transaminase [Polyangiaceae bacterium]|nr:3-phosphoserine/phosphohydroxythreonine transaminase [Polyangiaceae bacterium]